MIVVLQLINNVLNYNIDNRNHTMYVYHMLTKNCSFGYGQNTNCNLILYSIPLFFEIKICSLLHMAFKIVCLILIQTIIE